MYCSIHHQKADITIDIDNVPGSWRKLGHDDFENPLEDHNLVNEAEMISKRLFCAKEGRIIAEPGCSDVIDDITELYHSHCYPKDLRMPNI